MIKNPNVTMTTTIRILMMRTYEGRTAISAVAILISICLIGGCVTANAPNKPVSGPVSQLAPLEKAHPLLAMELRKLPELQDGLTSGEGIALDRITALYFREKAGFDRAFQQMYKEGLPERRKYSAPLQALFWMAEEGPFPENLLGQFSVIYLLEHAWTFGPRLGRDPWKDYDTVMDRLSSPRLVHHYVSRQINYRNWWMVPGYDKDFGHPRQVFFYKNGDCLYISSFVVEALVRNGYKAMSEEKPALRAVDAWHMVAVFYENGKKYIIDDGKPYPRGIMDYQDYY